MSFIGHLHFVSGIDKPIRAAAENAIDAAALELHVPVLADVGTIAPPSFFDAPRTGADADRAADVDLAAHFDAVSGVGSGGDGDFIGDTADRRDLQIVALGFA